jgi:hypothetical protein
VICGDAQLGNFGFYASPERDLVFDLNDFDEAHPGLWEWDLWWPVGKTALPKGPAKMPSCGVQRPTARQIPGLAGQSLLARSFDRMDIDRMRQRTTVDHRNYYVRQFRDTKGAVTVEGMDGLALMDYGRICGALLAKGHARSTGATMLSGYLGKGDVADRAFARFARAYADQTEADPHALQPSSPVDCPPSMEFS